MTNIVQFTQDLIDYVCKDNDKVKKGVMETMGGTVLETAKTPHLGTLCLHNMVWMDESL